jgi:hypothetical protein
LDYQRCGLTTSLTTTGVFSGRERSNLGFHGRERDRGVVRPSDAYFEMRREIIEDGLYFAEENRGFQLSL